ncbi:TPA: hypothetical protein DD712_03400 [Candidatus Acetothermia bacterium]|nr:hypothetical protein [Candidatus Acetothermia bacterium]
MPVIGRVILFLCLVSSDIHHTPIVISSQFSVYAFSKTSLGSGGLFGQFKILRNGSYVVGVDLCVGPTGRTGASSPTCSLAI